MQIREKFPYLCSLIWTHHCIVQLCRFLQKVGVPHLILGLLWQIIRHALLKNISLSKNVNIMALLKPGETLADLENLTPENVLIRWMNHHLEKGRAWQRNKVYFELCKK